MAVARRTRRLASKLGMEHAGELIGLLHDFGKYSGEFQAYLNSFSSASDVEPQDELRGKIDHSTAGAQFLLAELAVGKPEASQEGILARLLALCIASHHSGLIDCVLPEGGDGLNQRLNKADARTHASEARARADAEVLAQAEHLLRSPKLIAELTAVVGQVLHPKRRDGRHAGDRNVQLGLLVRMLFSCLIDADRTDTADFEKPAAARLRQSSRYEPWGVLLQRLDVGLSNFQPSSPIDALRANISAECFAAASRPQGLYTLTVPTGGGKTLAALRFALEHARQHELERVIFVSPYISIVDQNAAVARSILEPPEAPFASVVLEHHSNLPEEKDTWRSKVLAENWDAPVVFTTAVQVLEAMFGPGTRAVRRLHTMAKAVVVFDEVQTLPVRAVHLFNNALNLLTGCCGSTVLLCTATQPLLSEVDPKRGAALLAEPADLVQNVTGLFRSFERYKVWDESARPGGWSQEEVSELACREAHQHGSCLVVVNTKRDARQIYELCRKGLTGGAKVVHLSTGMCPAHRTETLARLKQLLQEQTSAAPVVCVSTQLIEAGVDIDFGVVVRDLAGLDSVAQAAGRCNRNGLRPLGGRVHIVKLQDLPKALEEIAMGQEATERVLGEWRRKHINQPFPLDDPAQMRSFFEYYYFARAEKMRYPVVGNNDTVRDATLLELLGANGQACEETRAAGVALHRDILYQSFKTAAESFAVIDGATQGIVVPFGDTGRKIVSDLCSIQDLAAEWQLLHKAQQYTVSVFDHVRRNLFEAGAVYEASPGTGIYCLQPEFYDPEFGLRPEGGILETMIE